MRNFHFLIVVLFALSSQACGDPVSLTGTWSGANGNYPSVVLSLTETEMGD